MEPEIATIDALLNAQGADLGRGDWFTIDQALVDAFAALTGDDQFIHVDPQRCQREGLDGTIAHGFLTLSLQPMLGKSRRGPKIAVPARRVVNYGLNKVRFLAPVPVPSQVRLHTAIASVAKPTPDAIDVTYAHRIEIQGSQRPALYAEAIDRIFLS